MQRFTSRWGMLLAMLGMAVGTGNIWRFPRIAASNGGGSFLVAWIVFLLLWSIPLLLVEFGLGKGTRKGPVGAFAKISDGKFTWMGAWVAFTATAIMFYYSVVMGWTLRYLWGSVAGWLPFLSSAVPMEGAGRAQAFWDGYAGTPWAVVTHVAAVGLGVGVVIKGVRGIEKAARILIPSLFVLVIVLAVRAVTLPGAMEGLDFLFRPDLGALAEPTIWLQALSQNAWDTGAGWGLIVAYSVYLRDREDTGLNAFVLGFGNNSVSLLAGIMVICTAFAVLPDAAASLQGAGNEDLTFIMVPQLFGEIPGGSAFMIVFFLALVFAAWSSLISMIELATRVLVDGGIARRKAVLGVGAAALALGLPSALSMEVFRNQDWVWAVGLMLSGLFFATAVIRFGLDRFRREFINAEGSDIHIGRWWNWVMIFTVVEAVVLLGWWLSQAVDLNDLAGTFTPFSTFNVGTLAIQWALAIGVFLSLNAWMTRKVASADEARSGGEDGAQ